MKVLAFTLALAGVTTAASLNAQVRPGTVNTGAQRSTDCSYNRTTNSVGDIIFGRTNFNTNCRDVYSRADGGWYQVGNGRSPIYERRVRDNYGYLIIQRARRNPNGTFTILNTRLANDNDKEWRKEQKRYEKAQKREQKEWEKSHRRNGNYGYHRDGDDDDRYSDSNYRYDQFGNRIYVGPTANTNRDYNYNHSKQKDHGRGKGKKDRD